MNQYLSRVVDRAFDSALSSTGAVLVEGPRACGKTLTARQRCASEVLLDLDPTALAAAQIDPSFLLHGPRPRLIDEWQLVPEIWNHVRRAVDDASAAGQFILTGSALPNDAIARHPDSGRFSTVRMRPMSLFEARVSSGLFSFTSVLNGERQRSARSEATLDDCLAWITTGGWPDPVTERGRRSDPAG